MSRYLVDRVAGLSNVEVVTQAQRHRPGRTTTACWTRSAGVKHTGGEEMARPIRHLFLFIGAEPNTDWLSGSDVALDAQGVLVLDGHRRRRQRPPTAGDKSPRRLRHRRRPSGSVKRVAAAVGEGAQVVATLHAFLAAAGLQASRISNASTGGSGRVPSHENLGGQS